MKIGKWLLAIGFFFVSVACVQACGKCGVGGSEKHMKHLSKKLKLSADQEVQIKKIMDEKMQKMEETGKQSEAYHKEFMEKVEAVLNEEQKIKFGKKMGKHRKHHCR